MASISLMQTMQGDLSLPGLEKLWELVTRRNPRSIRRQRAILHSWRKWNLYLGNLKIKQYSHIPYTGKHEGSHVPTLACWNICFKADASTPSKDWIQGTPASPCQRGGQCTAHDKVKNHLIHTSTHQSKIAGYCFQIAFVCWALIGTPSSCSHSHAAC